MERLTFTMLAQWYLPRNVPKYFLLFLRCSGGRSILLALGPLSLLLPLANIANDVAVLVVRLLLSLLVTFRLNNSATSLIVSRDQALKAIRRAFSLVLPAKDLATPLAETSLLAKTLLVLSLLLLVSEGGELLETSIVVESGV
ncbi:hypothetical protein HG530_014025 [Fusarium avenaceum]|nr:hypothetical protein HG530_014025 [Fusarium avenaceum]